jgi:predicted HicB family RNase H-like nuclease
MNNTIEYKNYVGSVEFSQENNIFYGKVLGIKALLSYEGTNAKELVEDFHAVIEDYLELCKSKNIKPEKAYKGNFNVRIPAELHKMAVIGAMARQISLNNLVENAIRNYLSNE